jgi:hypothetical protein
MKYTLSIGIIYLASTSIAAPIPGRPSVKDAKENLRSLAKGLLDDASTGSSKE